MERLATTRHDWWTRRVGNFTILCFYATVQAGALLAPQRVLHETVIGRPAVGFRR